jgi:type IV pilus assembly protein PilP
MMNKTIVLCCVSCGLLFVLALAGCDKQDEPRPETATVQSFKIEKVVTPVSEVPAQEGVAVSPATEGSDQAGSVDPTAPVSVKNEPPATGVVSESVTSSVQEADDTPGTETPVISDASLPVAPVETAMAAPMDVPALALDSVGTGDAESGYNPAGRIDPFEPLFQARQEKMSPGSMKSQSIRDARRGKLTPLEKLDISQLTLTAIIQGQQRNVAMVQESTGKGHVIKKGTYLGINSGRVVEITKNAVVIEEEVEDLLGKIIVRKREMKLQKPLGDM